MQRLLSVLVSVLVFAGLGLPAAEASSERVLVVDGADPSASDTNPGTPAAPLKTIARATRLAESNNTAGYATRIQIRPGVYRETVSLWRASTSPTNAVTYDGATDGPVVLSGSDVWSGWTATGDGDILAKAWTNNWGMAPIPSGWETIWQERNVSDVLRRRELVFVNGQPLRQVLTLTELRATPGAFYIDEAADRLSLRLPPGVAQASARVEVSLRGRLFNSSGWRNLTIRNLEFRHATTPIQGGAVDIDGSANVRIEDSRFDFNAWSGLRVLKSSGVTVLRSQANANGVMGFTAWRSTDLLYEGTDNSYNNWRGAWANWYGWDAGSKFNSVRRAVFRNHRATHNQSHGLWLDTDDTDVRVERSYLANNTGNGLYLEAIQGPVTVTGSVICDNTLAGVNDAKANNVTLDGNTIAGNTLTQVHFTGTPGGRTMTTYDTAQTTTIRSTGWTITNNRIATTTAGQLLHRTTLGTTDWELVRSTITADRNTYSSPTTPTAFRLPNNVHVDLPGWRTATTKDTNSTTTTTNPVCAAPGATRRVSGPDRIATSVAIAQQWPRGATTVVVAPGGSHAEALVVAPLAGLLDAPILLSGADELDARVAEEVTRLGATTVYVVGRDDQISADTETRLSTAGVTNVVRLAEPDPYALSARVARELVALVGPGTVEKVYLALGDAADTTRAWPDALSASALAAHERAPILLTAGNELPASVATVLHELAPESIEVVGGTVAVSETVAVAAQRAANATTLVRLAGQTRYGTSRVVAERGVAAGLTASTVWMATGRDFSDALAAGPAAARADSPVLLIDGSAAGGAPETEGWLAASADRLAGSVLVGGAAAITHEVGAHVDELIGTSASR